MIKLSHKSRKVIYLEEFIVENDIKKSYGLILISENKFTKNSKSLSFYKKSLRKILNTKEEIEVKKAFVRLNKEIDPFTEWKAVSNEDLKNIQNTLDRGLF